jgi:hypothetical protein
MRSSTTVNCQMQKMKSVPCFRSTQSTNIGLWYKPDWWWALQWFVLFWLILYFNLIRLDRVRWLVLIFASSIGISRSFFVPFFHGVEQSDGVGVVHEFFLHVPRYVCSSSRWWWLFCSFIQGEYMFLVEGGWFSLIFSKYFFAWWKRALHVPSLLVKHNQRYVWSTEVADETSGIEREIKRYFLLGFLHVVSCCQLPSPCCHVPTGFFNIVWAYDFLSLILWPFNFPLLS